MRGLQAVRPAAFFAAPGLGLALAVGAVAAAPSAGGVVVRQVGYVKAPVPLAGGQFGFAVALSRDGGTLAVGAPLEPVRSSAGAVVPEAGAVYLYARQGDKWRHQATLVASNPGENDQFGYAVAVSDDGTVVAVGAPYEDSGATGVNGDQTDNSMPDAGAVYVFVRAGTAWTQQAYIKASNTGNPDEGDTFGYAVALSGDGRTLAVGAPGEDSGSPGINGDQHDESVPGAGAVYVFVRSESDWQQQAYVKAAKPSTSGAGGALFGYAVALNRDGHTMAVGAFDEDQGKGGLYLFTRRGGGWSQQARLQAANAEPGDSLGTWVALSDDGLTVAAGALDEDSLLTGVQPAHLAAHDAASDTSAGAAYVFRRVGRAARWIQEAFIKSSNTGPDDWFGVRCALSGDGATLVVSAPNEDSAAQGINGPQDDESADGAGAVYVYRRRGGAWRFEAYVKGANTKAFDDFGSAVALNRDGSLMAVGARYEDGEVADSGAVYVFAVGAKATITRSTAATRR